MLIFLDQRTCKIFCWYVFFFTKINFFMEMKAHNSFARFENNPLAAICLVYCFSYKYRLIERLILIKWEIFEKMKRYYISEIWKQFEKLLVLQWIFDKDLQMYGSKIHVVTWFIPICVLRITSVLYYPSIF